MANMEPRRETKLTHLDIDCLERICRYLPLEDLLNMADSSEHLKNAADLVFLLKYNSKYTARMGHRACTKKDFNYCFDFGYAYFDKEAIEPTKPKGVYQLLRCFGHLISKLEIEMEESSIHFERTMSYVNEYCAESLNELRILESPNGPMVRFAKPFPNIHSLYVRSSDLENVSMIEIFPNMKRLTYHCKSTTHFVSIESDVPNLEHLELVVNRFWETEKKTLRKIRLNPKIRSLGIPMTAIYPGLSDILSNLQVLKLNEIPFGLDNSVIFHFPTVKRFEMIYYECRFRGLPFLFDKLEELILKFSSTSYLLTKYNKRFNDFIRKHPTVKKFDVDIRQSDLDISRLLNMLPLLEEFTGINGPSICDVVRFMNEKKSLKKITFHLDNFDFDIADIQKRLRDKWHGEKEEFEPFIFTRI